MNTTSEHATTDNPELAMVMELVEHTGHHVFLTGKAGTGKTTFLKNLKKTTAKRLVVTAPTGVAAINAGGVTLHSFFQLPFGPNIPGSGGQGEGSEGSFRFSRKKIQIMKNLDLLVIDEISMVRADVLDAVDAVLRRHRRNNKPFGGVQLLVIGDLYQLAPVARPEDWELLRPFYDSVYFFSSHALSETPMFTVELKRIYRQSDEHFIDLLNRVRDNRLENIHREALNRQFVENFTPKDQDGYITLTTHNRMADDINRTRLDRIEGRTHYLKAVIEGDFPEHSYPTFETLSLKAGAQVMFLRNDASPEKRFFNGKIGRVMGIAADLIRIRCPEDIDDIELEPVDWENITYSLNEETGNIEEKVLGTFRQFPLRLAWAVTIHKSQGLTFDRAVIDSQAAFAHGQVYVALSRCRTLSGMVLRSPVPVRGLGADEPVARFMETVWQNPPGMEALFSAKRQYQENLLMECFDFQALNYRLNGFLRQVRTHDRVIRITGAGDLQGLAARAASDIVGVGEKFKNQLRGLFKGHILPEQDSYITERVEKASLWFQEKIASVFDDLLHHIAVETDNRDIEKSIRLALTDLRREVTVKRAAVQSCEKGFSPAKYLRAISRADMDAEALSPKTLKSTDVEYAESDIRNPELFQNLKIWRTQKAEEKNVKSYQVLHQRVLVQIAVRMPGSLAALKQIRGLGEKTLAEYGNDILALVTAYRTRHGIEKVDLPDPKLAQVAAKDGKSAPSDTRQISFSLFQNGMPVSRIATERGITENTVLEHLTTFVGKGELSVDQLLSPEKKAAITEKIIETGETSLKAVKLSLGDEVSYGDIRVVMAHREWVKTKEK